MSMNIYDYRLFVIALSAVSSQMLTIDRQLGTFSVSGASLYANIVLRLMYYYVQYYLNKGASPQL